MIKGIFIFDIIIKIKSCPEINTVHSLLEETVIVAAFLNQTGGGEVILNWWKLIWSFIIGLVLSLQFNESLFVNWIDLRAL